MELIKKPVIYRKISTSRDNNGPSAFGTGGEEKYLLANMV